MTGRGTSCLANFQRCSRRSPNLALSTLPFAGEQAGEGGALCGSIVRRAGLCSGSLSLMRFAKSKPMDKARRWGLFVGFDSSYCTTYDYCLPMRSAKLKPMDKVLKVGLP